MTNDDLLEPFRRLGLDDVAAYQAAGNVTFRSDGEPEALEALIEEEARSAFGFDVPTFVRRPGELRAAVDGQPFSDDAVAATEGRIQITFFRSPPTAAMRDDVASLVPHDDLVEVHDRHWYWLPLAGVSGSTLPVSRIEDVVGPMTMRTLATVRRLLDRFCPPD